MTPGEYLALRRGAAGLTQGVIDAKLGWEAGTMADIEQRLRTAPAALMEALHGAFPFDPIIARRIGEGNLARICTGCGCSEMDACWDDERGGCNWVAPSFCSDCKDRGILP